MPRQYTRKPLAERFWTKVDRSGGSAACWPWTGHRNNKGYGMLSAGTGKSPVLAHRVAYELAYGPLADGQQACHDCPEGDNRACCNPAHLFSGTAAENSADMAAKGRSTIGERNPQARLTVEQVREIRRLRATGLRYRDIALRFGVSIGAVGAVVRGQHWNDV
jgi:cold shock CspA family protein